MKSRRKHQPQDARHPHLTTGKTSFLSRTANKHATEARTATRITITSIKQQPEKLVFSVIQQQACYRDENSYPHNNYFYQTATGKTSFPSRTTNKHAAKARTTSRIE